MMNKNYLIALFMLAVIGSAFAMTGEFFIVKDKTYVPSPIAPQFHEQYVKDNYNVVLNKDNTVSYVLQVKD